MKHAKETGSVVDFPGSKPIENDDMLTLKCEILIPAALGGVIFDGNAKNINCKLLMEAANGPTTPTADDILESRGITVVPDILTNAGGVVVSYFEWVQNHQMFNWQLKEVEEKLTRIMVTAWKSVHELTKKSKISYRTAAYAVALERVIDAAKARGI